MKRWVLVTDRPMELRDLKGQVTADTVPRPDDYEAGNWLEVVVSEAEPRLVWRLLCVDVAL
jgi:hypothetical protein